MSDAMKIGLTGLVPAERMPRNVKAKGKPDRWFYVGRSRCSFNMQNQCGYVESVEIPTRAIQRALCLMELQLGSQRAMRKRKAKKGARKR